MNRIQTFAIIKILIVSLSIFFINSCGPGGISSTPTPFPLIKYQAPSPINLGTLNGKVLTSTDMSTGKTVIRGIGVTMDSGESIDAFASANLLKTLKIGDRVALEPAEQEEFQWRISQVNPTIMPSSRMENIDGTIHLDFEINNMVFTEGAVFVLGEDSKGNKLLSRIDPVTAQVSQTNTVVEDKKHLDTDLVTGDQALWVYIPDNLYKIDPTSLEVLDTWSFEHNLNLLAVEDGIAWLERQVKGETTSSYQLIRYDLKVRKELNTTKTMTNGRIAHGDTFLGLTTRDLKETTDLITGKEYMAEMYVLGRVDPQTGVILDTTAYSNHHAARGLTSAEGSFWLALDDGSIAQVDEDSAELIAVFPIIQFAENELQKNKSLQGIDYGEGALWVGHPASGSLLRVDPKTHFVTHVFSADGKLSSPKYGGNRIWVIVGENTIAWVDADDLGGGY